MDRRQFLTTSGLRIARWTPALGLLGFRFKPYTDVACRQCWLGSVEWGGRLVGFVRANGDFFPFLRK